MTLTRNCLIPKGMFFSTSHATEYLMIFPLPASFSNICCLNSVGLHRALMRYLLGKKHDYLNVNIQKYLDIFLTLRVGKE